MDYNQSHPYDSSQPQPQPSYYSPYSYTYPHHLASSSAPSYYLQPPPPGTERAALAAPEASYYPADGMNPAAASAVTALTQLTEFATSMGASERAMGHQHQAYPPQYPPAQHPTSVAGMATLRGGRRGGGSLRGRGRGRGSSTHHHLIQDIGATSFRGRERGQGHGRGGKGSGRQLALHATAISSAGEVQPGTAPALAHMHDVGQVTVTNTAKGRVLLVAWCDVCRVECNSKEILEQHKNGKRHKRTMQRMQEMAGLRGMITPAIPEMVIPASQGGGLPDASSELAERNGLSTALHMVPPVGSSVPGHGDEMYKDLASENGTAAVARMHVTESAIDNSAQQNIAPCKMVVGHSGESQLESQVADVQSHQPASNVQSVGARMDGSNKNGIKRKMTKSERGGKKLRLSGRRPERVREQPMVCTLCNVTCDTRAVFDIHLGGKKHLTRLKRSQGADTIFGPLFLYIPPNRPVAHPLGAPEPVFYGLKNRDMVDQETYLLGAMQHKYPVLPQAGEASMVAEGIQVTTYAAQPMAGAMNHHEIAGSGAEQVGNGGLVTAPLGTAAVEADAIETPPPC